MKSKTNSTYKSKFVEQLVQNDDNMGDLKDYTKVDFRSVIEYILNGATNEEVQSICDDINNRRIECGMDSNSIKLLVANKDNKSIANFLKAIRIPINIDVNGLTELGSTEFNTIRQMGCKIDKVHVNSGCEEAAARGYGANVYSKIITGAEKISQKAFKDLPENASELDRFMALYNAVIEKAKYDYTAVKSNGEKKYTARNLERFFTRDGLSICAGTADVLKQLCEMNGIEAEYVQGDARANESDKPCYHAWVRVKINGKWYNADPTWDALKVGEPYEFCLKSDNDFKGHVIDENYKPTFMRDSNGRSIAEVEREENYCFESYSSEDLQGKYYTDELARKKAGRALTSDEIDALNKGISGKSTSIIARIIDAILNFGRKTKSKVNRFFRRENIEKMDFEELSEKSDKEMESYLEGIQIDNTEKIPTSAGKKAVDNKKKEKEADDRSR